MFMWHLNHTDFCPQVDIGWLQMVRCKRMLVLLNHIKFGHVCYIPTNILHKYLVNMPLVKRWQWRKAEHHLMMTSSNGNIFHATGHLCGEFTGPRWIPPQRPVTRSFDFSLISVWISDSANNREAGDLRRYRAHYDVVVMYGSHTTIWHRRKHVYWIPK